MTDRERHKLMGFIDKNDHFDILKLKPLFKKTLIDSLNAITFLTEDEKIEQLELQKIIINEVIIERS